MTITEMTNAVQLSHVHTANACMLRALHYHRYFAGPTATHPAQHRATMLHHATEAGRYACFSERNPDEWYSRYPQAVRVPEIWDAFVDGYRSTAALLAGDAVA